jgi:hypothetical protein
MSYTTRLTNLNFIHCKYDIRVSLAFQDARTRESNFAHMSKQSISI